MYIIIKYYEKSFLGKFEVELSSDMVTRHENIPVIWNDYLNLLEEAKKALEMNKDKFKAELLEQAEVVINFLGRTDIKLLFHIWLNIIMILFH